MQKETTVNELMEFLVENMVTKQEFGELLVRFDVVESDVGGLKQDVGALKQDIGNLKQDVNSLKQDVSRINQDIGYIKQDVNCLKDDMVEVKGSLARLEKTFFQDSNAHASSIVALDVRTTRLEKHAGLDPHPIV